MAHQLVQSIGAFVNSTLPPAAQASAASFASHFKNQATAAQLYAGLDWNSLNIFEQLWVKWYLFVGNPHLATGISSFVLHEFFYFGRCVPWIIIDQMPYFRRWKIQEAKVPTAAEQWKCTKYVLYTHFTMELPQIAVVGIVAEYFGMETYQVPFPSLLQMASAIATFFVLEDFWHYWAHRALHWGPLYKRIHKLHHTYSAPFGLAAEYAHPLEILILGMGTVGGPLLWCYIFSGNLHIVTMYIWIILRLFQAVDAHSGYDFPWSLQHIFPLWSGADHHDYHHEKFSANYSTSFRIWDYVFGTEGSYRANRKALKEKKAEAYKQAQLKKAGFKTS